MKEPIIYPEGLAGRPAPLFLRRVSWGAIFAGLAVALVLEIVLSVLGVAIGASTIEPLRPGQAAKGYGIGTAIWFGVSSILALFAGACVAGRLSGGPRRTDGLLHGVATWATATLLSVFLLTTTVGSLIGGTAALLARAMFPDLQSSSAPSNGQQSALSPTGRSNEEQANNFADQVQKNPELIGVLSRMFSQGGAAADPQDREAAINLLSAQGMSREEAASTLARWDRQYQQTKAQMQQAPQLRPEAARGVAVAAWWSFGFLILSACAAALGGFMGTRGLSYTRAENPAGS